jgi:omega-6 fatty acid desaturase (delta-12 desaturase)
MSTQTVDIPSGDALGSEAGTRAGSLKPVLDIIPPEAYRNPTWKGLAYLARDTAAYALLVWALIEIANPLAVLGLEVLMALVVGGLFIIGHDVAHGALFKSKRLNSIVGHVAMLPGWHVYEGWVLGHNRIHHAYTVRQGYDFVWHPYTAEEFRAMGPWQRARHRIEWSWAGAGFYYMREVWWHKMVVGRPPARWVNAIRRDRWIVAAFVAVATAALAWIGWDRTGSVAGTLWLVTRVLVLPFVGFSYLIGSLVHVHHVAPDIRWWKRREWDKFKGQVDGTTILRARWGLNFFFHWIMVHIPHHVDMRIPMYNLELAAEAIKEAYPDVVHDEPLRFADFVRNTRRCKLYDFEQGRWLTYAEARQAGG